MPVKTPTEALKALAGATKWRADIPIDILVVQSVMAGIYIAMATQ
jgi:hypothetical protein